MAESGGFEPPVQVSLYNGLANRRLQPLGQLSCTAVANFHGKRGTARWLAGLFDYSLSLRLGNGVSCCLVPLITYARTLRLPSRSRPLERSSAAVLSTFRHAQADSNEACSPAI